MKNTYPKHFLAVLISILLICLPLGGAYGDDDLTGNEGLMPAVQEEEISASFISGDDDLIDDEAFAPAAHEGELPFALISGALNADYLVLFAPAAYVAELPVASISSEATGRTWNSVAKATPNDTSNWITAAGSGNNANSGFKTDNIASFEDGSIDLHRSGSGNSQVWEIVVSGQVPDYQFSVLVFENKSGGPTMVYEYMVTVVAGLADPEVSLLLGANSKIAQVYFPKSTEVVEPEPEPEPGNNEEEEEEEEEENNNGTKEPEPDEEGNTENEGSNQNTIENYSGNDNENDGYTGVPAGLRNSPAPSMADLSIEIPDDNVPLSGRFENASPEVEISDGPIPLGNLPNTGGADPAALTPSGGTGSTVGLYILAGLFLLCLVVFLRLKSMLR